MCASRDEVRTTCTAPAAHFAALRCCHRALPQPHRAVGSNADSRFCLAHCARVSVQRDIAERGRQVDGIIGQYLDTVKPAHERFIGPVSPTAQLMLLHARTRASVA